jgi:hypothetical protein
VRRGHRSRPWPCRAGVEGAPAQRRCRSARRGRFMSHLFGLAPSALASAGTTIETSSSARSRHGQGSRDACQVSSRRAAAGRRPCAGAFLWRKRFALGHGSASRAIHGGGSSACTPPDRTAHVVATLRIRCTSSDAQRDMESIARFGPLEDPRTWRRGAAQEPGWRGTVVT